MMNRTHRARAAMVLLCAAPWVAACGESTIASDGGAVADAGIIDANVDAGEGTDAGLRDQGVDATAPEECASPGATRTATCGNCGLESQRCAETGVWERVSECLAEGECAIAAVERDTSRCGDRARICDDACAWRPWTVAVPQGECDVGETRAAPLGLTCTSGEIATSDCGATCSWVDSCRTRCAVPPAPSRTGAVPLCVPEGPFVLGSALAGASAAPSMTITLSSFHIDREMVSAGRYRACVAAGACPAPEAGAPFERFVDGAIAVQLPGDSTAAFCAWDGGMLPTEYQWEKAARGPSPDDRVLPREVGASGLCSVMFCTGRVVVPSGTSTSSPGVELLTSALEEAYSPFGVHQIGAGVFEYTRTLFKDNYAGIAARDPGDQPGSGPDRVIRGGSGLLVEDDGLFRHSFPTSSVVSRFAAGDSTFATTYAMRGFRCVY